MTRDEIITADKGSGGMFAIIPGVVLKDSGLSKSAILLYGIITWKCNSNSYCWASNRVLAEEMSLSPKRVSELISDLEASGHIETEIERDPESGEIKFRRIFPVVKSSRAMVTPIPKNTDTSPEISGEVSRNSGGGIPKNTEIKDKYKLKDNTPQSPPEGGASEKKKRKRGEPKSAPDWKPERFEAFWRLYPLKKSKQAAIRAWDLLQPDDNLLAQMGHALQRQILSQEWQRKIRDESGQGIPYPASWINGRRWEDEDQPDPASSSRGTVRPERFGWD